MLDPERMLNLLLQSFPADYPVGLGSNDSPKNRIVYLTRKNKHATPHLRPQDQGYVPLYENVAELPYAHFVQILSTSTSEDHALKRMVAVMCKGVDPIAEFPSEVQTIINQKIAEAVEKLRLELTLAKPAAPLTPTVNAPITDPLPELNDPEPLPPKPRRRKSTHLRMKPEDRAQQEAELIAYAHVHGLPEPSYRKDRGTLAPWWVGMVRKHQRGPAQAVPVQT